MWLKVTDTSLPRLALSPRSLGVVINIVRLYLDLKDEVPAHLRPEVYPPTVECEPEEAPRLIRRYQRQGFNVTPLPL